MPRDNSDCSRISCIDKNPPLLHRVPLAFGTNSVCWPYTACVTLVSLQAYQRFCVRCPCWKDARHPCVPLGASTLMRCVLGLVLWDGFAMLLATPADHHLDVPSTWAWSRQDQDHTDLLLALRFSPFFFICLRVAHCLFSFSCVCLHTHTQTSTSVLTLAKRGTGGQRNAESSRALHQQSCRARGHINNGASSLKMWASTYVVFSEWSPKISMC